MKGIMFNEHYGLDTATLNGSKIRTSRIEFHTNSEFAGIGFFTKPKSNIKFAIFDFDNGKSCISRYGIGEIVAIAQCYKNILSDYTVKLNYSMLMSGEQLCNTAGWHNKMFVKAEYMPNQIQITDINIERLQDISDEDCIREGIHVSSQGYYFCKGIEFKGTRRGICKCFETPREAFAHLIDKVSRKGTWTKNPWVVVYYFKLLK